MGGVFSEAQNVRKSTQSNLFEGRRPVSPVKKLPLFFALFQTGLPAVQTSKLIDPFNSSSSRRRCRICRRALQPLEEITFVSPLRCVRQMIASSKTFLNAAMRNVFNINKKIKDGGGGGRSHVPCVVDTQFIR